MNMRLTQNSKAISGLSLILLLLTSAIIGAFLSYLWAIGYYESLKIKTASALSITNASFDPQHADFFRVTILHPTYSNLTEPAEITQITVLTLRDGVTHNVTDVSPSLEEAGKLKRGESKIFRCTWNWGNYSGETIRITASVAQGSGGTREFKMPFVSLEISDVRFNPAISVSHFNMTVKNSVSSVTYVNVTGITVDAKGVASVSPKLPYTLHPNDSVPLMCSWDWTDYQGENVTITVDTLQGYAAYYPKPPERTTLPPPTNIQITDVLFDAANMTRFNVTVQNSKDSPTYVNITRVDVTVENETFSDIDIIPPDIPYTLHPGANVTFTCAWNWTDYREKNATILIHTLQDFTTPPYTETTTARVILTITDILFDEKDTEQFNVTVQNSKYSLEFVNITKIDITMENGTSRVVCPSLNYTLDPGDNATFTCVWNWKNYRGKNVMVALYSLQNYTAHGIRTTRPRVILEIPMVSFDLNDTTYFNVTVENSECSLDYVLIMGIAITFENGTAKNVTVVPSRSLPQLLYPNQSASFMCLRDWSEYRGKNFTVTVYTYQEYSAESTPPMPFVITEVLFNATDTEHFTITIQNSATSITYANITEITVTVEEGAPDKVTQVTPALPHTLYPNKSESFVCTWNWTNYEGRNVTIAVHTLQGYTAYALEVIPERVLLEVVNMLFNVTDTAHFNMTVGSSELSVIEANITEITITSDGIVQNVTEIVPSLPYILQPRANVAFKCSWNWTEYQGQTAIITIRTSRGYLTSAEYTIPTVP